MAGIGFILRCVGQAAVKKGVKGLCSLVPLGEYLYEVAEEVVERIKQERQHQEFRQDVEEMVKSTVDEVKLVAHEVSEEVAAEHPPEMRQALASYLEQVPAAFRRSLERPEDPSGRSVPATFVLSKPEHVLSLLPTRLPRYKVGDRPTPGGNWELTELLGMGGFGEVWKARHRSMTGMTAAIKFCIDEQASASLRNEAALIDRVMQESDHPGILVPRDAFLEGDPVCLIYPYVPGGDLTAVAREIAAQPPEKRLPQVLIVMGRLAEIVGQAHRLVPPIVHRDLKPANVLVVKQADGKIDLRVTDFGIGGVAAQRALDAEQKYVSRSAHLVSSLRGTHTPLYASKQQREGADPDPRDDVYAMGVMTYQLLTGELAAGVTPTWADELEELGYGEAIVQLIKSCLATKPEKRPRDATELAKLLAGLDRPSTPPVVTHVHLDCDTDAVRWEPPVSPTNNPERKRPQPKVLTPEDRGGPPLAVAQAVRLSLSNTGEPPVPRQVTKLSCFDVVLDGLANPGAKFAVVYTVRELTGRGLADSKSLVERAPVVLQQDVPMEVADAMRVRLEKEGAKVTLRPALT